MSIPEVVACATLNAARAHRRPDIGTLKPGSLGEATEELAGSELMQRALGEHIFPRYIELKRSEWNEYRMQVTQWELDRYLAAL